MKVVQALLNAATLLSTSEAIEVFDRVRLQDEARNNSQSPLPGVNAGIAECNSTSCYRYYNDQTKPYFIEHWPDVPFETGEFYGGSVPIDENDPSRTLFFIFKPAQGDPSPEINEVTIWLNGGPGCSSLLGFFQENGPFTWKPGTLHPERNWFAWSKMTNMLWVYAIPMGRKVTRDTEQPVGTGFSTGKVHAHSEIGVAKDFVGFFKNWEKLFGIENYKIYITGESYAGRYVPYISAGMLDQNDTKYFDVQGGMVYDPCIGDCSYVQGYYPTYQFALANNAILNIDEAGMAKLKKESTECGYEEYLETYLQFPPPKNQPPDPVRYPNRTCQLYPYDQVYYKNPCFNVYHITDYCPILYDPTGGISGTLGTPYFDRPDVKAAIHAPHKKWYECAHKNVFVGADRSPDPIQGVLPQVIEATNRFLVSNADWDALILTNGTLLSIQNMTWNGALGFQSPPVDDFVVPFANYPRGRHPQGVMGKKHFERGLMWVETYQAGHMQPQYQPAATWQHLQWVLGRIDDL